MQAPAVPLHLRSASRPMQVRFFHGRELETLELALNTWLAERVDREIVDVRQSVIPATTGRGAAEFVVSVWYIEG